MTRLTKALACLTLAALSALTPAVTAHAADAAPLGPATGTDGGPVQIQADGNFYAYIDINYGGGFCRWSGRSNDWGACRNQASSLYNNGFAETYDDVWVFWDTNNVGSATCIGRGWAIADLRPLRFVTQGTGQGQTLHDNIASHRWAHNSSC